MKTANNFYLVRHSVKEWKKQLKDQLTNQMKTRIYLLILFGSFLTIGCTKQDINQAPGNAEATNANSVNGNTELTNFYQGLSPQTLFELRQARAATARYRDIRNAYADNFEDLGVNVENMGSHFMLKSRVDAEFDYRKPEILVYHKDENGKFELGAVEYAIPLEASPNKAPEGFTGSTDEWEHNDFFGLWLLHAWVWTDNPDGIFHPTNPLVHLH